MAEWTEDRKQTVIDKYTSSNPTAENSTELVKAIAEEMSESPNGVRMILMAAQVYIKKGAPTDAKGKTAGTKTAGEKAPRVSKDDQISALREAIEAAGKPVDDEILTKLTGKAAVYFLSLM